ncbi:MAG: molybdate ABC transporter substrate-binding protein, partial [Bacillota bacterium]|nr:molybdate ABC transporter substrate-binding protein [Bacillota bacterium]
MKKLETTLLIAAVCIMAVFSMFFRLMFAKDSSNDNKSQKTLLVHAASSLTEAFQEVGTEFEKDTGVKVDFNFAGSQALYNMIKQGEKGDIFASASLKYMEDLEKDGLAEPYSVFAENKIVICRSNGYKGDITSLKDLGKTGLRLVLADKSVPVGSYFYTALDNACKSGSVSAEDKDKILKNVVSSEVNVKDVLGKVLLGEADCGVVYNTDLSAA